MFVNMTRTSSSTDLAYNKKSSGSVLSGDKPLPKLSLPCTPSSSQRLITQYAVGNGINADPSVVNLTYSHGNNRRTVAAPITPTPTKRKRKEPSSEETKFPKLDSWLTPRRSVRAIAKYEKDSIDENPIIPQNLGFHLDFETAGTSEEEARRKNGEFMLITSRQNFMLGQSTVRKFPKRRLELSNIYSKSQPRFWRGEFPGMSPEEMKLNIRDIEAEQDSVCEVCDLEVKKGDLVLPIADEFGKSKWPHQQCWREHIASKVAHGESEHLNRCTRYSAEVEAVLTHVEEGKCTLVSSVAGSGKTRLLTTLYMIHSCTKPVLALAFNKTAAQELRERGVATATTYHAYGLSLLKTFAIKRRLKKDCRLNKSKTKTLLEACIKKQGDEDINVSKKASTKGFTKVTKKILVQSQVNRLVSLAKANGLGLPGLEDLTKENLDILNEHFGVIYVHKDKQLEYQVAFHKELRAVEELEDQDVSLKEIVKDYVLECTLCVMKESITSAIEEGQIDFDDMIYIPLLLLKPGEHFLDGKYTLILMDEAQDTNKTRMEIIAKSLPKEGQIVAVGDQLQAIYGYAGAGSDSLSNIQEMFNTGKPLSLPVSYRLPTKIIDFVNQFLVHHASQGVLSVSSYTSAPSFSDHIKAAPGAKPGFIALGSFGEFPIPPLDSGLDTAILCRKNDPLISLFYALTKQNILCNLLGRKEIGTGMQEQLRKALKQCAPKQIPEDSNSIPISYAMNALHLLLFKLIKKKTKDGHFADDDKFSKKRELVECALAIIECLKSDAKESNMSAPLTLHDLEVRLKDFSTVTHGNFKCVTLCSIHKSKGMGFHRVYILNPEDLPLSFLMKFGKRWEREQELHVAYVAYTRSYSDLIFLSPTVLPKNRQREEEAGITEEFRCAVHFFGLEIPVFCDSDEVVCFLRVVKAERRVRLLQCHPDKSNEEDANGTTSRINGHYETIMKSLDNIFNKFGQ